MNKKYLQLLTAYADRLCENQLSHPNPAFDGGILCPACASIHGRIADAVYPLAAAYDYTKDERYLACARRAVEWAERNVARASGGIFNDKTHHWIGITVFSAISFGEVLLHHGDCLDDPTRKAWLSIFRRSIGFIKDAFNRPTFRTYVNYFASYSAALALSYRIDGKEEDRAEAYRFADRIRATSFSEEGLLVGEGGYADQYSPKGCRPVDVGYNVEESLPALTLFAHLMQDGDYLELCTRAFLCHLQFMLPDGAWDNSFGTRANKWTYWGSRTSDGAQIGLVLLADRDERLREAAERSFALYERCSRDGYLYGGYQYIEADEEPCIHHTFCHAKAVAAMLDAEFRPPKTPIALPRDSADGLRYYPSLDVRLVALGDFRATVSGYDVVKYEGAATTGGTVTVLWHTACGPIAAATPAAYRMAEPRNMQLSRHHDEQHCTSWRIRREKEESVNDKTARLSDECTPQGVRIRAKGHLKSITFEGETPYELAYEFTPDAVTLHATCREEAELLLPIVCDADSTVRLTDPQSVEITRRGALLQLTANRPIGYEQGVAHRSFHVVGGFLTERLSIALSPDAPVTVTLRVLPSVSPAL